MYARKYKIALAVTTFSMLALVGVQLLIPWIIRTLVSTITSPGASLDDMPLVTQLTIGVLVIYLARAGMQFLRSYLVNRKFLSGWAGFIGSVTEAYYVFLKYAKLYESRQQRRDAQ